MSDRHELLRRMILNNVDAGQLPEVLYKFRRVDDWLERILRTKTLYFSSPLKFNDPFDGQITFDTVNTLSELATYLLKTSPEGMQPTRFQARQRARQIMSRKGLWTSMVHDAARRQIDTSGICCFSQAWNHILQWSYYADGHKGVALTFSVRKDPLFFVLPIRVEYVSKYPWFNYVRDQEACIKALITAKAKAWEHEQEVRIWKKPPGEFAFEPEMLTEITFGANCSANDTARVKGWCAESGLHNVKFFKANTASNTFSLVRKPLD